MELDPETEQVVAAYLMREAPDITGDYLADARLRANDCRHIGTEKTPIHAIMRQPFSGSSGVGGDQATRNLIDMEFWAHGFIKNSQSKANVSAS